jgi:hypothetical protein
MNIKALVKKISQLWGNFGIQINFAFYLFIYNF